MADARMVRCQDCGHTWESTAEQPRCTSSGCRKRNVVEVGSSEDDYEEDGEKDDSDPNADADSGGEQTEESATVEQERDESDDSGGPSGGFTPAFESAEVAASTASETPAARPAIEDEGETTSEDSTPGDDRTDDESDSDETTEDIPEIDPETLVPVFNSTFSLIDSRMLADWELREHADREDKDPEAVQLATAWAPVINHYAPALFKQNAVAGAAVITTAAVLAPRLREEQDLRSKQESRERERENGTGSLREPVEAETTPEDEQFTDESTADVAETAFAKM